MMLTFVYKIIVYNIIFTENPKNISGNVVNLSVILPQTKLFGIYLNSLNINGRLFIVQGLSVNMRMEIKKISSDDMSQYPGLFNNMLSMLTFLCQLGLG
jgi:hypothetical protein